MLKPDHITRNYSIKLLVPSCLPHGGCRGRELGSIDNCYNLLLYIVAATSATLLFLLCYYKLLADSSPMLQDSSEDASLR